MSLFGTSTQQQPQQQQSSLFGRSTFGQSTATQQQQQQPQQQQSSLFGRAGFGQSTGLQPQQQQQQPQQQTTSAFGQSQAQPLSNSLWQPGSYTPRMYIC